MFSWRRASIPADVPAMQDLVSRSWAREKPMVNVHVGDLEWWTVQRREEPDVVSLWYQSDQLVGWAWHSPPGDLETHIDPDHRTGPLYGRMLEWFEDLIADRPTPPPELVAFVFDPTEERAQSMEALGYRLIERAFVHHVRSLAGRLDRPVVAAGFSLRPVEDPADIERRVAVHRSAFSPSRMTAQRYRAAMACPHYRPDLDWVAVAPEGEFAAFCNVWLDASNGAALLEPVGTAEGYRRMGLARAVCQAAMATAAGEGADTAIVLSDSQNGASMALYRSLGFEEIGRTRRFTKPPTG